MQKNIYRPLDITSTTLRPQNLANWDKRLLYTYERDQEGGVRPTKSLGRTDPPGDCIGQGLYSTPSGCTKLLTALLKGGAPILSNSSVETMFLSQVKDRTSIDHLLSGPARGALANTLPSHVTEFDHSLAGLRNVEDIPHARRSGTSQWIGAPCGIWVSDSRRSLTIV